jgi:signal transduction histidine kinase
MKVEYSQMSESDSLVNQLRATLSKMELALSTVGESIVWTDSQGRIKWCNASLEKLFNQNRLFILGASLIDKLPLWLDDQPVSPDEHPVAIALATRKNGSACYQWQTTEKTLTLQISWSFIEIHQKLTELDDTEGSVLVLRDITEAREAERKLQEANELLEQQVLQRTQELRQANEQLQLETIQLQELLEELQQTQSQLIQSEKMSSLGQLVAGIAHEINNPINFIHGNLNHIEEYVNNLLDFVQLYQKYYPEPIEEIVEAAEEIDLEFLQEDLHKILRSLKIGTKRIREIVLSLRNFSRIDESEVKVVDIHEGIDSTLLILQHRLKGEAGEQSIQLVKDYGDLPLVECYPGQLNQVFMNILVNAIDAIEDNNSPGMITIKTSVIDNQWIEIAIKDNGTGIPEAIQGHIFNPFFTTKPIGKGTGMGMAISYKIITEKHGGKLTCISYLEMGTTMKILIPLYQKHPPEK